jgi:hypothetical protein
MHAEGSFAEGRTNNLDYGFRDRQQSASPGRDCGEGFLDLLAIAFKWPGFVLTRRSLSAGSSINMELEEPGSALAVLRNALVTFAERNDLSSGEGCMGMNAICVFD